MEKKMQLCFLFLNSKQLVSQSLSFMLKNLYNVHNELECTSQLSKDHTFLN